MGSAYTPLRIEKSLIDFPVLASVAVLCIAGVIFVFTSSAAHSWQSASGDSIQFLLNHVQRLMAGIVALIFFYHVRYQFLERLARPALFVALAALAIVLLLPQLPGTTAKRWISLFGVSFQPAEFAKYALIIYCSKRLSEIDESSFPAERQRKLNALLIVISVSLILIVAEPNLSTVILISGICSVMLFLHGIAWKRIALLIPVAVIGLGMVVLLKPYMLQRITAFIDGISNPLNASYHIRQSLIAIGQGGISGLGLGQSTQKHYYLPEPYNDSIFSIIAEEIGLVGALMILAAFSVLILRGWKIALSAQDRFSYYLSAGITVSLALSMVTNIGVNLALLPATGQPLPFISYGGTSIVMSLAAIGILLNVSKQQSSRVRWQGSPRPFLN